MSQQKPRSEARRREGDKEYVNNKFTPFVAKNEKQKKYFNALNNFQIVFGVGASGSGKTALAFSVALTELYHKRIDKIVITRPAQPSCGENLGHLPGTIEDKFSVYLEPLKEIGEKILGESAYEMLVKTGKIVGLPLAYMRGRTFDNSYVICDESQNMSKDQLLMLLTRIGVDSKIFINGDSAQMDKSGKSALDDAIGRLSWMPEVKVVEFTKEDIVRSRLISDIITSYEK